VRLAFQTALTVGAGVLSVLVVDLAYTVHRERGVIELEMRDGHERLLTFAGRQVSRVIAEEAFEAAKGRTTGCSSGPLVFSLFRFDEPAVAKDHAITTTRRLADAAGRPVGVLSVWEVTAREESFLEGSMCRSRPTALS